MLVADKARIVAVLNQRYRTTLPVELVELAVGHGFTSWAILQTETERPAITCPVCQWTSYNLKRYCGHCHRFHEDPPLLSQTSETSQT